ncbi:protein of unknown function [Paraburkholderia dioscoreae]|uniref:Uncharacterized protein n=1 Tax=Paraburkholderia dioscoreae TaxID=2604047 RepID=A0A5Q4ZLP5_9BURK|nr:protein of unknown function [Paraburkholderia dioscoreae]
MPAAPFFFRHRNGTIDSRSERHGSAHKSREAMEESVRKRAGEMNLLDLLELALAGRPPARQAD